MLQDLPVWVRFFPTVDNEVQFKINYTPLKLLITFKRTCCLCYPRNFEASAIIFFAVYVDVTVLIFSLGLETIWLKTQKIRSPEFYQQRLTIRAVSSAQNSVSSWISSTGRMLIMTFNLQDGTALQVTYTPQTCALC